LDRFHKNWQGCIGVHDVINLSKFGVNIFRGFRSTGGQNFRFPTDFAGHRYNSADATAQPVMDFRCNFCFGLFLMLLDSFLLSANTIAHNGHSLKLFYSDSRVNARANFFLCSNNFFVEPSTC